MQCPYSLPLSGFTDSRNDAQLTRQQWPMCLCQKHTVATRTDSCALCVMLLVVCVVLTSTQWSAIPINLLSANHGNAWNVLMPGILVVGGGAWPGGRQGDGALEVKTRFSHCSLSYVWPSQENVTVVFIEYPSFIWRGLRPNGSL